MPDSLIDRLARSSARRASRRGLLTAGGAATLAGLAAPIVGSAQDATPGAMSDMTPPPDLNPGPVSVRKNVSDLSSDEKEAYVNAVLALKQKPSPWFNGMSTYDTFVAWHRDAFGCATMSAHMGPAFLPWHRVFVRLFELQLQEIEPTVAVPYWDWTVDNTPDAPVWDDDFMGGDGDPKSGYAVTSGPFAAGKWAISIFDYGDLLRNPSIVRAFGQGFDVSLPTTAEVTSALAVNTYDSAPWNSLVWPTISFRNTMEGWRDCVEELCNADSGMGPNCTGPHVMHNGVHLWIGGRTPLVEQADVRSEGDKYGKPISKSGPIDVLGTMTFNSSPNDPVFFQHHANIDRLFDLWLAKHGPKYQPVSGGPLGHNINDLMWPYHQIGLEVSPGQVLDSSKLGYKYA